MRSTSEPADIFAALARLDALLRRAVDRVGEQTGVAPGADPFRGKYISHDDVARSLASQPGAPLGVASEPTAPSGRLTVLAEAFALSAFDLDVFVIALAPEVDLRYTKIYAYLQDDVTRRRPSVDFTLSLLCGSAAEKLARRARLLGPAPLVHHRLIEVLDDATPSQPFLSRAIIADEQISRALLGIGGIDPRIAAHLSVSRPDRAIDEVPLPEHDRALLARAARASRPAALAFHGREGAGQLAAAEALASAKNAPLLAARLPPAGDAHPIIPLLVREASLSGGVLLLDDADHLLGDDRRDDLRALYDALATHSVTLVLSTRSPWRPASREGAEPLAIVSISFGVPAYAQRRTSWQLALARERVAADDADLDALASRFRLTAPQIAAAAAGAVARAAPSETPDLFAAARAQSAAKLGETAAAIPPRARWDDLVVPENVRAQLHELSAWIQNRHRVIDDWGFGRRLSYGKGTTALFTGAAGTGKTLAAEILAGELGLDLYRIDLSGVVSKYIGETEKNLDRVFTAAEDANAVLFFDEADALFGKRSEVNDSHDRYANIEISYLLQKMEAYEGLAILATNLRENLDKAFIRRLAFIVTFPFPEHTQRRQIWHLIWPDATPLSPDVDLDSLARDFRLSGGQIKNVALAAAFLAAPDGIVEDRHIRRALSREYEKQGKSLRDEELVAREPIGAAT